MTGEGGEGGWHKQVSFSVLQLGFRAPPCVCVCVCVWMPEVTAILLPLLLSEEDALLEPEAHQFS